MNCYRAASTLLTLTVSLSSSQALAQVIWTGDFETENLSQYQSKLNETVDGKRYIQIVEDPVVQGRFAAKVELHDDARWSNGLRRVELQHRPADERTAEGATTFFAWSFYIPTTFPADPSQQIGYWESRSSYRQMMAFEVKGEDLVFVTRQPNNVVQWQGAGVVTPGMWHRIAMSVTWSKDANLGEVNLWFDGAQVVSGGKAKTLNDDNPHFVQFGILRGDRDFDDVPVIILDDAVEGETLADVRPDLTPITLPMEPEPDMAHMMSPDMGTTEPMDLGSSPDMTPLSDMALPSRDMADMTQVTPDMAAEPLPTQIKERVDYDRPDADQGGCAHATPPSPWSIWPALMGLCMLALRRRRVAR